MPIDKRKSLSDIIAQEIRSGKPPQQAAAIAYRVKGKSRKKNG